MALEYSTAFRNFIQCFGSKKQALWGGVMDIYDGSGVIPTSPDLAATGEKLCRVTLASGAWVSEVLSSGTVTLSGSGGQVDSITVNSVELLSAAVVWDTDLATTAAAVAAEINAAWSNPKYMASSSGAVVTIQALPTTGTGPNGFVVVSTCSGGTLAGADVNLASGVAQVNGFTFGAPTAGAFSRRGVMSGVNLATGYAAYFRFTGSRVDAGGADASPWNLIRIQGTCGTSGADYNMDTTYLVLGATHTIDTWTETLAE
jgi:hypothetical protein